MEYLYGPDSERQPGTPEGSVHEYELTASRSYPGTERRYWAYVPAGYDASSPASLMVFQDGWTYLDPDGLFRAGIVLDNLIHSGGMPVTIGVFVDPGDRNAEYDAFDGRYVGFVVDEVLPALRADFAIADDPGRWGIGGGSSGGSCALTAAWHRPDRFRRVLSLQGSFAQIRGGNPYPRVIEEAPAKPLRVFLTAESRDLNANRPEANWFSSNLRLAAALAEQGYDVRLSVGDAEHTMQPGANRGAAILPDALRWLWRPAVAGSANHPSG